MLSRNAGHSGVMSHLRLIEDLDAKKLHIIMKDIDDELYSVFTD